MPPALKVVLRAAGALGLLALAAMVVGPQRLLDQLRAVDPVWFVLAVAASVASQVTSALRWGVIARVLGLQAPTRLFLLAYARGITVNVLVPGATVGGDTLRSVSLHRHGNPLGLSIASVLLDRLSGLWVLCAMSLVAALAFAAAGRLPAGALGPMTPYLVGLAVGLALPLLPWKPASAGPRPASGLVGRVRHKLVEIHALLVERRLALLRSLWGSVLVQLGAAGALWLCLLAVGGTAGFWPMLAVSAPIFVAAALPVSLGGFGTREFAAAAACPLVGIPAEQGVAAAVLYGLMAIVVGLLCAPSFAVGAGQERPA